MEKSLNIPLQSIKDRVNITICCIPSNDPSDMHFSNISTPWLMEFLKDVHLETEEQQQKRIFGKLTLEKTGPLFRLTGKIHCEPTLECSRCLCLCLTPLDIDLDALYLPDETDQKKRTSLHQEAFSAEEVDAYIYKNQVLELDSCLLDAFMTNLPDFILCHKNCLGLCQNCGENLNSIDQGNGFHKKSCLLHKGIRS